MERFIPIGYIHKVHGLKGELKASFEAFFMDHLDHIDFVFLNLKNCPVPFKIEYTKPLANELFIIKLEGINDPAMADPYQNTSLLGDTERWPELLDEPEEEEEYLDFLIDYVAQINGKNCGTIVDILYSDAQDLAVISFENQEFMAPLLDETIHEINRNDKSINFNLPENYLSVFLDNNPSN